MELKGKAALVTGASSGIGAAIAVALGRRGARVALTARRHDRLEGVARKIRELGGEALIVSADLRDEKHIIEVFEIIDEQWGRLDILVNNAGLARKGGIHEGASAGWREMFDVNVIALAICSREALARFPEEGGHIVNISSMSGHRVPPTGGVYSATKHAATALTEVIRRELRARGSKSRITAISPGFTETEFFEQYNDGDKAKAQEVIERFERMLQPEDIAASVLHALEAPAHVAIHDILLRPTEQES